MLYATVAASEPPKRLLLLTRPNSFYLEITRRSVLATLGTVELVAIHDVAEVASSLARGSADYLLIDLSVGLVECLTMIKIVRRFWPAMKVVVIHGEEKDARLLELIATGVSAIWSGGEDYEDCCRRIGYIQDGMLIFSARTLSALRAHVVRHKRNARSKYKRRVSGALIGI